MGKFLNIHILHDYIDFKYNFFNQTTILEQMLSRRNFLKSGSVLAVSALALPHVSSAAKVQNVGIQLYTVRKEMLTDAKGTLAQLAKLGYKELESARSEKGHY